MSANPTTLGCFYSLNDEYLTDVFEQAEDAPLYGANLVAAQFLADTRTHKIDLGVGVYRNDAGETPIMAAVKQAEARLVKTQRTKSYLELVGDRVFSSLMLDLIFGETANHERISVVQTSGGVAAIGLCCHVIKQFHADATVWVSDPSWANHVPIINHTGLSCSTFPYYDPATSSIDFEAMCACLETIPRGDVILLQACCHNPTGADLSPAQWDRVAQICRQGEILPFLDVSYQGLAENLAADVYGVRACYSVLPEMIVVSTCSKTFSVYRDRAGIAAVVAKSAAMASPMLSHMRDITNVTHSMPADHAAAVVRDVLSDSELNAQWQAELQDMCERIQSIRTTLAAALKRATNTALFDFLPEHNGMFSMLPLTNAHIDLLQEKHAIYIVQGGRTNVAGLRESEIDRMADAIADVLRTEPAV